MTTLMRHNKKEENDDESKEVANIHFQLTPQEKRDIDRLIRDHDMVLRRGYGRLVRFLLRQKDADVVAWILGRYRDPQNEPFEIVRRSSRGVQTSMAETISVEGEPESEQAAKHSDPSTREHRTAGKVPRR